MIKKVSEFIASNRLLDKKGLYLTALSGGADSVALLLILRQLGYSIEAIHCNFHLRGKESDRDELFCVSLCEKLGVKLHRIHFDTHEYAALHKVSIEMAARELRYQYFFQLKSDLGAAGVCVAHHRDDSVETVLLNLVRGTGLRGLRGIQPSHDGVIRPLLCVSRQEIESFLLEEGQDYVTDSTNFETEFSRNRIRLEVLPLLREINPSASDNIFRMTQLLGEAEKLLDEVVKSHHNDVLDIAKLDTMTSPRYLLYEVMKDYGFSSDQVEQMFRQRHGESGRLFVSETHEVAIDRGRFIVEKKNDDEAKTLVIPEPGTYVVDEKVKIRVELMPFTDGIVSRDPRVATLDASTLAFPLTLRTVMPGDRFHPFGMQGSRLVSDYLTDRKKNIFEKRRQLVVADATGAIVWLVGERTDDRNKVREGTSEVLLITA
ncbi:MAG: tRNA lysidine(34) synthetase TilS [Prevotella sp.]|nr:tRNA lysidine(34) synthetase TilS [Prevotella sp.]